MAAGKAVWDGATTITLIQTAVSVLSVARAQQAFSAGAYDAASQSGCASLQQLHHVPVSNARRLLGYGKNSGAYSRSMGA